MLVLHYNNRRKNARNDSIKTERYLMNNGVDFAAIAGKTPSCVGFFYDWQELLLFLAILCSSVVPTFVIACHFSG